MMDSAVDHPEPNVWVIDPQRRNGHRLDAAISVDDIFREHDGISGEDQPSSYQPVNMAEALKAKPLVPELGARADGKCLLYRGKTHWVFGDYETAKSWLCQFFVAEELRAGKRVYYLDYEDSGNAVGRRLLDLGVPRSTLVDTDKFGYSNPIGDMSSDSIKTEFGKLLKHKFDLVVLDGVTEAMSLEGLDGNPGKDVSTWQQMVPNAIARRTGAAVVCIDHVPKDKNNQAGAIGSQHKMAGVSGAAYMVLPKDPFGKGLLGCSEVRVRKDRPGSIRGHLGSDYRPSDRTHLVAHFVLDSRGYPNELKASLKVPGVHQLKSDRPTWCMEQASLHIESDLDKADRSQRKITEYLGLNAKGRDGKTVARDAWRAALDCLVDEGYMERVDGPHRSKVYRLLRPYRQESDPQSDKYDENALTPEDRQAFEKQCAIDELAAKRAANLAEIEECDRQLENEA
jgi:hypothetical protein